MPLDGQAELLIGDGPDPKRARVETIAPGSFVYYPAYQHHTIRNAGRVPITYLMFKWRAPPTASEQPLKTGILHFGDVSPPDSGRAVMSERVLECPTMWLGKLHLHVTEMKPARRYEPHVDPYDIAVIVLSGKVETLGKVVEPMGVVYCAAGEPHGMANVGSANARYLVFEFHGTADCKPVTPARPVRSAKELARVLYPDAGRSRILG